MKNEAAVSLDSQAINEVLDVIKRHRQNAYRKINEELVTMYFEIGKYLSEKVTSEKWGTKVIDNIAREIRKADPTLKGFDRSGLYRMMQFYETYRDNVIVSTLSRQISWSNNIAILSRTRTMEEKEFYIRMCVKNNYSARELNRQISSGYYQRYMLSGGNALESVEKTIDEDDVPMTRILDQYSLEFLDLPNNYSEKDLRKAIVHNLKDFILEIGRDFSFVGEEYRVQVGNRDFYIDLVFYNRAYSCLVAFELKIGEFQPEYISKMDFYLEALDRYVKKEGENPSVGIVLCASKDDTVVEFAQSRSASSTLVSTYQTDLIDKDVLRRKLIEYKKLLEGK